MITFRTLRAIVVVPAVALAGCNNPFEGYSCTSQFVYGIAAYVEDSLTGAKAASGATLEVHDGSFTESSTWPAGRPDLDAFPLTAAGERSGTYTATVTKSGYAKWTKNSIKVSADKCHVKTVTITARLVKN